MTQQAEVNGNFVVKVQWKSQEWGHREGSVFSAGSEKVLSGLCKEMTLIATDFLPFHFAFMCVVPGKLICSGGIKVNSAYNQIICKAAVMARTNRRIQGKSNHMLSSSHMQANHRDKLAD